MERGSHVTSWCTAATSQVGTICVIGLGGAHVGEVPDRHATVRVKMLGARYMA
jgi:hypothetical protein